MESPGLTVALSSNMRLPNAPGNVLLPSREAWLPKDSAASVTQVATLDQDNLTQCVGRIPAHLMAQVDAGLSLVLDL